MRLEPWQLIKLKREYGGVYIVEHEGNIYACRQPTWLELVAQHDVKEAYNLSISEVFIELQKQTLVYPENVEDVPQEQLQMLADAIAEDIPFTEDELQLKLETILSDANVYRQIILRLWQQMNGTTLDQIYNRPIKEVLEMYQTAELLTKLMENNMQNLQNMQYVQSPYDEPQHRYVRSKPIVQTSSSQIDLTQFMGKPLDEVLRYLAKQGGTTHE